MHKIMYIESTSSCIKNYTGIQLFEFYYLKFRIMMSQGRIYKEDGYKIKIE